MSTLINPHPNFVREILINNSGAPSVPADYVRSINGLVTVSLAPTADLHRFLCEHFQSEQLQVDYTYPDRGTLKRWGAGIISIYVNDHHYSIRVGVTYPRTGEIDVPPLPVFDMEGIPVYPCPQGHTPNVYSYHVLRRVLPVSTLTNLQAHSDPVSLAVQNARLALVADMLAVFNLRPESHLIRPSLGPIQTPEGAWVKAFPIDVLGNPMREVEDGRWENSLWPSEIERLDAMLTETFQNRVRAWVAECFGEHKLFNIAHRNTRFFEEAVELGQSSGLTLLEAQTIVALVYSKPKGEFSQEVGGVLTTLAALCTARKKGMVDCGEQELKRIWPNIEKIRAKEALKALPHGLATE